MSKALLIFASVAFVAASTGSATIILSEPFTYADGVLTAVSSGVWVNHSGTANQVDVASGKVNITGTESEDVNTSLGGTYTNGTLSATFDINFSVLPTTAGTYFTHFKDATTSGFRGRLFSLVTGAAAGTFRLGIADTTTTVAILAQDLSLNTTYSVTLNLDVATGRSSFSVGGGSVTTATDATSALSITSYALRQASSEGTLTMDNLVVDAAPPVPEPSSAIALLGGASVLVGFRRLRRTARLTFAPASTI